MSFKTENQIWKDLVGVIDGYLATSGQTGWITTPADQPIPVGISDKMVLVSRVFMRPVGWQGSEDKDIGYNYTHIEKQRAELRLQLSFLCQRHPATDTVTTWTANDMAEHLRMFLNSYKGIRQLAELGYRTLRCTTIRNASFIDDSETYEFNPSFDLTLLYEQTLESEAIAANLGALTTKPI